MSVKLSITVTEGPDKGQTFELAKGEYLIGRNRGEIALSDKKISSNHCKILVEDDKVILHDLGSTNGTFVGSARIDGEIQIQNLDVITVGLSRISVAIVEELNEFKKQNLRPDTEEPGNDDASTRQVAELPDEDARYRTTGINRIEGLIDDEIKSFSKWDHPAVSESSEPGVKVIPKVKVSLHARKAPDGITEVTCDKEKTVIGRKGVDVRINDLDLSRKHAAVEIVAGSQVFIRDLASTNGTYVNGARITYQEVKNGDLLQVGQSVFEIVVQSEVGS